MHEHPLNMSVRLTLPAGAQHNIGAVNHRRQLAPALADEVVRDIPPLIGTLPDLCPEPTLHAVHHR